LRERPHGQPQRRLSLRELGLGCFGAFELLPITDFALLYRLGLRLDLGLGLSYPSLASIVLLPRFVSGDTRLTQFIRGITGLRDD
jgi:hypothetical protein